MNKDAEGRWKVGMSNIKLKMRVKFIDRTLKNGDDCVDLSAFRNGDGFINVLDAFAERGNVMVTLDLNLLKKRVPPHIYLLNDAGVQRVILRALGVQE